MACVLKQVNIEREGPGLRSLEHQAFCFALEHFLPLKNILNSGAQSTAHSFEELDTFSLSITMLNFCDGVFQLVKQASSLCVHERWTEVRDTATEGCVSAWCLFRSQGRVYCLMPPFPNWWGSLATCHTGLGSSTELLVTWRKDSGSSCFVWIFGKTTLRRLNIIDRCPVFSFFFATPHGMQKSSSPVIDQTRASCSGSVES